MLYFEEKKIEIAFQFLNPLKNFIENLRRKIPLGFTFYSFNYKVKEVRHNFHILQYDPETSAIYSDISLLFVVIKTSGSFTPSNKNHISQRRHFLTHDPVGILVDSSAPTRLFLALNLIPLSDSFYFPSTIIHCGCG